MIFFLLVVLIFVYYSKNFDAYDQHLAILIEQNQNFLNVLVNLLRKENHSFSASNSFLLISYSDEDHEEFLQEIFYTIMQQDVVKMFELEQVTVMSKSNRVELFQNVLKENNIKLFVSTNSNENTCCLSSFICCCSFQSHIFIPVYLTSKR